MRIAVVGSGVAGLVAAHRLQERHDVVLFEAEPRLGGHAHTVTVPGDDDAGEVPVDTGFLVFNARTYPRFVELLAELAVPSAPSDMSFSVRSDARDFEYNGRGLSGLYAQRRRLLSPRFHRMVWDILRFYREAPELFEAGEEVSLGDWLGKHGYSRAFKDDHLTPMIRAVWSARRTVAEEFPARFLARFFHNHGFLSAGKQPPWLTVPGGSRRYVEAIARGLCGEVRTFAPIVRVAHAVRRVRANARRAGGHFDRRARVPLRRSAVAARRCDELSTRCCPPFPTSRTRPCFTRRAHDAAESARLVVKRTSTTRGVDGLHHLPAQFAPAFPTKTNYFVT
jgi:predicted NAD/FAD-binding protein